MIINKLSNTNINTNLRNLNHSKIIEVISDGEGLRKNPNPNSEIIAKVTKGDTVNILGTHRGFAKVNYEGKVGYLNLANLKFNAK